MNLEAMLPDWDFVAGSTQSRTLTLLKPTGEAYDMQNGVAHLAIVDYVNGGEPVYTRQTALSASDGKYCVVTFVVPSDATKELFGRYTYQITILDGNGNAAIPQQGRMMIYKNIQPDAL